ncbi:MAG: hypothetical protein UR68_C0001G0098 [Candidatus Roizmanbacteria bacterium GW2011_GWA2_35_19]|uniref:Cupin 2 conserved barrel domain-containing protein n=2 Tax=Candidatus Roizmaniibacteriota TaxID=1752723 RepID=A0A0G0BZ49_9BACT|nr:MAG: hypothetical protein UR63_C0012G0001 [Candidatus Roizmanbacteria bacterium GW2011_GWC2_35_12]KKP74498.1 MAG: hypothetical protein UR68_C0001G0098 [Candidatus Roizmanbacteria bacterium GW2011_GWA2_35_19]
MQNIDTCEVVEIPQGKFYLGKSNKTFSQGYLELKPFSSLLIHNRPRGFENLTQVKNSCVMIVFDKPEGSTHKLNEKDKLRIVPEGTWHIHSNPSDKLSITYWYFEGDIRYIVDDIRKNIK